MRLVTSEWPFEGAAGCIRAWGHSHRSFSLMELEGRRRKYFIACLEDHNFQFGALEKFTGKIRTSCGHGDDWNVHFRREDKRV